MSKILRCKNCFYKTVEIDDPYGLPNALVSRAIEMHKQAHPTHDLIIVERNK